MPTRKPIQYSVNNYRTCDTSSFALLKNRAEITSLLWFSCRRKTYPVSCEHNLKPGLRAKIGRKKRCWWTLNRWLVRFKNSVVHCDLKFLWLLYRRDNSNYVNWLLSWADSSYKQIKQTERFYSSSKEMNKSEPGNGPNRLRKSDSKPLWLGAVCDATPKNCFYVILFAWIWTYYVHVYIYVRIWTYILRKTKENRKERHVLMGKNHAQD